MLPVNSLTDEQWSGHHLLSSCFVIRYWVLGYKQVLRCGASFDTHDVRSSFVVMEAGMEARCWKLDAGKPFFSATSISSLKLL